MFSCHGVEGPAGLIQSQSKEPSPAQGLCGEGSIPSSFVWGMEVQAEKVTGQKCCAAAGFSVALRGDVPLSDSFLICKF